MCRAKLGSRCCWADLVLALGLDLVLDLVLELDLVLDLDGQ